MITPDQLEPCEANNLRPDGPLVPLDTALTIFWVFLENVLAGIQDIRAVAVTDQL